MNSRTGPSNAVPSRNWNGSTGAQHGRHAEPTMSTQTVGILLGGVLAAVFFGLSGAFVKSATQAGIGTGLFLLCAGIGTGLAGLLLFLLLPDKTFSLRSGAYSSLTGLSWALGAGLVSVAIAKYAMPISKLVPIYNTNTLITVLIGLVIFLEWKDVNPAKLLLGAVLVIVGTTLVATS